MPAKRANKKSKPGNKPKTSRRATALRSSGIQKRSSRASGLVTAPAAVSSIRKSYINYSSTTVGGQDAMRISATVPICQIGDSGTYNNGLFFMVGTTAVSASSACTSVLGFPLSVTNSSSPSVQDNGTMVSPHVPLLALAFDKYSMRSLTFHYEPQAATSVSDRLVFAWTEDAAHPFLSPYDFVTQAAQVPTQLQLLVTKDSVAFAPWRPWSLKVPVDPTPRFTFEPTSSGDILTAADVRLSTFGAMSCVSSAGSSAVYGILYASMVLDLIDPVPLFQTANIPLLLNLARTGASLPRATFARRLMGESKEEKGVGEDDPVVLSPGLPALAPPATTVGWFGASPAQTPTAPPPQKKPSLK